MMASDIMPVNTIIIEIVQYSKTVLRSTPLLDELTVVWLRFIDPV
jgi:hypothetical protein